MKRFAFVLLTLIGCGRGEVFGLGQPDSSFDGGELSKDGETFDADTGIEDFGVIDTGIVDTGTFPDVGPSDRETPDFGPIEDAEPSPDAERDTGFVDSGNLGDGGIDPDSGLDGGTAECTVGGDCNFNQVCDPQTLTCVQCVEDGDCGPQQVCDQNRICRFPCFMGQCGPLGVCDPNQNVCVECIQSSDCPSGLCDQATQSCVECIVDADCALEPGQNICNTAEGRCVGCASDADCTGGETCFDQQGGVCVPPTNRELCDPCTNDDQCGGPNDLCIGIIGGGGLIDRSCALDCSQNANVCPSGFECVSVRNGELQCRPRYDMQTPTCTGTRHLGSACNLDPNDVDPGCGIEGVQDARCESIVAGGPGQCVVWCVDDADCANGTTCQPGTNGVDVCR